MSETRWLSAAELDAWKNLSLMQLQLTAQLGRELAANGLSLQDYLVLASLSDQSNGASRVVELSRQLGWEKSRASHHITRMIERGLVEKVRCPSDQRGAFVVLTAHGRHAIESAAPCHVESVRQNFIDLLSSDQLAVLDTIARKVLDHLSDSGCG